MAAWDVGEDTTSTARVIVSSRASPLPLVAAYPGRVGPSIVSASSTEHSRSTVSVREARIAYAAARGGMCHACGGRELGR